MSNALTAIVRTACFPCLNWITCTFIHIVIVTTKQSKCFYFLYIITLFDQFVRTFRSCFTSHSSFIYAFAWCCYSSIWPSSAAFANPQDCVSSLFLFFSFWGWAGEGLPYFQIMWFEYYIVVCLFLRFLFIILHRVRASRSFWFSTWGFHSFCTSTYFRLKPLIISRRV